ncbi:hypothetical protein COO91_02612 [Nostoc flagelliforme CCNUN1]|uniref:Uncharacterized protein n=1 Tax=Nostoc flagelliforme CCNUN1 TaxID=2038116 RepID=A0A2K8SMN6_9NOSO|nr:hypothetical protein COO91_02612 [Nostoc flagelliforme CCNUN1]
MKPDKTVKMLGFIPQPNLPPSDFLSKTYVVLKPLSFS